MGQEGVLAKMLGIELEVSGMGEDNGSGDLGHGGRMEGKEEECGGKSGAGVECVVVGLLLPADCEKGGRVDPRGLAEGEAGKTIRNAPHLVRFVIV